MQEFYKKYIKPHKDILAYAFWGVVTTIVNLAVYHICFNVFHLEYYTSSVIAWIAAVATAYLTNRKWVFHSKAKGAKEISLEALRFTASRIASLIMEMTILFVGKDIIHLDENITKYIATFLVIILNYVLGKVFVFTGGNKKPSSATKIQKNSKKDFKLSQEKQSLDLLNVFALLYLYIPIFLFLVTWINLQISIPIIVVVSVFLLWRLKTKYNLKNIYFIKKQDDKGKRIKTVAVFLLVFLLILAWCTLSGIGGFTPQTNDWQKHNVIFRDLVYNPWPVRYNFNGNPSVIMYYIGSYLVPAAIGKFFGSLDIASVSMLFWFTAGIFLSILLLYRKYGQNRLRNIFIILACLILFATFMVPLFGVYRIWLPEMSGDGMHWLSGEVRIQYTSAINLLRWVPTQFIPTLVSVALFLDRKEDFENYIPICAPLMLYSSFTFIGLALFMIIYYIVSIKNSAQRKEQAKRAISVNNIVGLAILLPLTMYIACNIFQAKPDSAKMTVSIINYFGSMRLFVTFIVFELSWIIWALLLRHGGKDKLLIPVCIILTFLPFIKMGKWGDLCMRASIPALIILAILVAKRIIESWKNERFYAFILIGCILISGAHGLRFYVDAIKNLNFKTPHYNNPYTTSQSYYESEGDVTLYQYLVFSSEPAGYILQE